MKQTLPRLFPSTFTPILLHLCCPPPTVHPAPWHRDSTSYSILRSLGRRGPTCALRIRRIQSPRERDILSFYSPELPRNYEIDEQAVLENQMQGELSNHGVVDISARLLEDSDASAILAVDLEHICQRSHILDRTFERHSLPNEGNHLGFWKGVLRFVIAEEHVTALRKALFTAFCNKKISLRISNGDTTFDIDLENVTPAEVEDLIRVVAGIVRE